MTTRDFHQSRDSDLPLTKPRLTKKRKYHQISQSKPLSSTSTNSRHDQRCRLCKDWAFNLDHFQLHFVRCTQCPFSYHRHCIDSLRPGSSHKFNTCSSIEKQCSSKRNRSPSTLFDFVDRPYKSRHFTFSPDGTKVFIDSLDTDSNQKRWRRDYYESIRYKEVVLRVGDSVEVRNANSETSGPQWSTNVAMIKEICNDENSDIPIITIFWYWRERELKWNMDANDRYDIKLKHESPTEQRQYMDYHIYCDIDYVDEIWLDTITRKVRVLDTHRQFEEHLRIHGHPKKQQFGLFYGELFVSAPPLSFRDVTKHRFRERLMEPIRNKKRLKVSVGATAAPRVKVAEFKKRSRSEDIPILERIKMGLTESDSSSSDDSSEETEEGGADHESDGMKRKKRRKLRTALVEENVKEISSEDMATMNAVCRRLHLVKGPNIGSRLYHFKTHLAAYQSLDELFQRHSEQSFGDFVQRQKQSWCRDVKSALYTKGVIVPLKVLKENISKRFNELKPFYNAPSNGVNGKSNGVNLLNGKSSSNGNVGQKRNGMKANVPALKKRRIA